MPEENKKLATVRLSPDEYEEIAQHAGECRRTVPQQILFMATTWTDVMDELCRTAELQLNSLLQDEWAWQLYERRKAPLKKILSLISNSRNENLSKTSN